eukprot:745575-Rhodomonas_salina.4
MELHRRLRSSSNVQQLSSFASGAAPSGPSKLHPSLRLTSRGRCSVDKARMRPESTLHFSHESLMTSKCAKSPTRRCCASQGWTSRFLISKLSIFLAVCLESGVSVWLISALEDLRIRRR